VELKADSLEYGRRVDAEAKRITTKLLPIKEHLKSQEDVIKKEKERIAAAKQKAKEERHLVQIDDLIQAGAVFNGKGYVWGDDNTILTDSEIWNFPESGPEWPNYIFEVDSWNKEKKAKEAEIERERKEEEDRQAKIAEENRRESERLAKIKADQDAQAAKIKAEQDKIEAEKKAIADAKAKEIADKKHAEEIEAAKKKAAAEAKKKAEEDTKRREQEKLEAEEAEKKRRAELEKQKPDKEKMAGLLRALKAFPFAPFNTKKYQLMSANIKNKLYDLVEDFNNKL